LIASAVGGELAFFDLNDLQVIRTEQMTGWATALELVPGGSRFIAADNETGALAVFSLPEADRLEQLSIGGTPIDLRLSRNGLTAHLLTNNSRYFRIATNAVDADTHFTGPSPRRLRLRPHNELDAWITCRGDNSIRVVQQEGFFEVLRIPMPSRCTDIEFSPDGVRGYCALPDLQLLFVLDATTGVQIDSFDISGSIIDLAVSTDGHYLLSADSTDGMSTLLDLVARQSFPVQLGTSAIRPRYSAASAAFFAICPTESYILRLDPYSTPPQVTDTIRVEPIPQCMSFLE